MNKKYRENFCICSFEWEFRKYEMAKKMDVNGTYGHFLMKLKMGV